MKSPPEPESMRALAGMRRFPKSNMTERTSRESELDDPEKVMAATEVVSTGSGVSNSVI